MMVQRRVGVNYSKSMRASYRQKFTYLGRLRQLVTVSMSVTYELFDIMEIIVVKESLTVQFPMSEPFHTWKKIINAIRRTK